MEALAPRMQPIPSQTVTGNALPATWLPACVLLGDGGKRRQGSCEALILRPASPAERGLPPLPGPGMQSCAHGTAL